MSLSLRGIATSLFGWIPEKYPELFTSVRENLPKADIKMTYVTYVSFSILMSLLIALSSMPLVVAAFMIFKLPFPLILIFSVFVPFILFFSSFLIFLFYPSQKANGRRVNIENNLPFILTHIGAVVATGIPPHVVFRLVSRFKAYGEAAKEFEKIVYSIDVLGIDPLTAIKEVADRTPSDELKQVLMGFVTTVESGGNAREFLKTVADQVMFRWTMKREKFLQQLSTFAELYTGLLIAAPLFIISLFAVMAMIQPTLAGYNIQDLMQLCIYILVPAINIGFLLFLKGIEVPI